MVSTLQLCPLRCFSRPALTCPSEDHKHRMKEGRCCRFTALPAASKHHSSSSSAFPLQDGKATAGMAAPACSWHTFHGALAFCPAVCKDLCQVSPLARAFLESKAERLLHWGCTKGFKNSSTVQRVFPFSPCGRLPHPGHCS